MALETNAAYGQAPDETQNDSLTDLRRKVMYRGTRLLGILVVGLSASSLFLIDGTRPSYAQDSNTVKLTFTITDAGSGFSLKAEKQVTQGMNALDAVRQIVSLRYTTHPTLGPFVTELAGVSPPAGWRLFVDGEWSDLGIAGITLEGNTVLEFSPP